jgi:hypothetical protein
LDYAILGDYVDNDNIRRRNILTGKGKEYTDGEDALSNFKLNAVRLGMHPCQVLAIYMFKHINSIETYLKQFALPENEWLGEGNINASSTIQDSSEGITSRIDDAVNYLELMHLLLIDLRIVNLDKLEKV